MPTPKIRIKEEKMDMLKGIAIVIDNEINDEESIKKILKKIKGSGIPTSEFDSLDSAEKCVNNFISVNFIILDWKMLNPPAAKTPADISTVGVTPGSALSDANQTRVINFIKTLQKVCFAPIFIFTTESKNDIENQIIPALRAEGLYSDDKGRNFIYVRNKKEILKNKRLFKDVKKWIYSSASIYLLKIWDREFLKAKNEIFWDLYNRSHGAWPKLLWQHFTKEKECPHSSINEMIFQLLLSKTPLKSLDSKKILNSKIKPKAEEAKEIFRRTMYQDGELLNGSLEGVKPGDIFKVNGDYYLNIRPECDTVEGRTQFENKIYTIKGTKLTSNQKTRLKKQQYRVEGGFMPKPHENFVLLLDGNHIINFTFSKVYINDFLSIKAKRVCRLFPPYITNIQQRFSAYIGRYGVPRLPKEIEKSILKTPPSAT